MSIISFRVHAFDSASTDSSRRHRRAYLSPDVLRTYRLIAGDWVELRSPKGSVVVQLWPRAGLEDDGTPANC